MRKILIACLMICCWQGIADAQAPRSHERSLKNNQNHQYLVFTPQNYDKRRSYPLMIVITSGGGSTREQYEQWNFYANHEQYIMLCPRFFRGFHRFTSDEDTRLIAILREMKKEFRYDAGRVTMAGFLLGADYVQNFMFAHPGIVTAGAILEPINFYEPPFAGKGRKARYFLSYSNRNENKALNFIDQMERAGNSLIAEKFPTPGSVPSDDMKLEVMKFFKSKR